MILVTGGNGFIGSNLIKCLLNKGHDVTSIDNLSTGLKEYEVKGCKYIYDTIENINAYENKYKIIFHLAALSRIQPSFNNPIETLNINGYTNILIAEWAKQSKLIYSGSSSQWNNPSLSPYSTAKKIGEDIFKMYKKVYNCRYEIARFYNVYGPNELTNEWAAVIGKWRKQIQKGKKITIVGDGKQKRDFTHVDDIIDGLYKIAMSHKQHDDAWELGTNKPYSINEVAMLFDHPIVYTPDQKGNYKSSQRVNSDAIDRLGWRPKDRLKQYVLQVN